MCTSLVLNSRCRLEVTAWVLEIFFDSRRERSSMLRKSMLPPTLSCMVRSSCTPRSSNSLAITRWVMVAPTWLLMSSPTIGTPASVELLGPHRVRGDEHRQRVDERHAGVDGALRVELVGLLGAHRQVGDHHVDVVVLERLDHVDRPRRRTPRWSRRSTCRCRRASGRAAR